MILVSLIAAIALPSLCAFGFLTAFRLYFEAVDEETNVRVAEQIKTSAKLERQAAEVQYEMRTRSIRDSI